MKSKENSEHKDPLRLNLMRARIESMLLRPEQACSQNSEVHNAREGTNELLETIAMGGAEVSSASLYFQAAVRHVPYVRSRRPL
jgi:hypothetical protein